MDTFGYDMVYALAADQVNTQLKAAFEKGLVTDFSYQAPAGKDPGMSLRGRFGAWQIVGGGQNRLIRFNIPIETGSLEIGAPLSRNYDLSGALVEMEFQLGWLGSGSDVQTDGDGSLTHLVFNWKVKGTRAGDTTAGAVTTIKITPNNHMDAIACGLVHDVMPDLFIAHRQQVNYIFASINPTPPGVGSWLSPKRWRYFYNEAGTNRELCILSMLSDNVLPDLAAFDSSLLREGCNAFLMLSQEVFLRHMVLPGLQKGISGNLRLTSDAGGWKITNNGDIALKKGTANHFCTEVENGNTLRTTASGGGPLKFLFGTNLPHAHYSWDAQLNNPCRFDTAGNMYIFEADAHPIKHSSQSVPWYDWVLLTAVGIASAGALTAFILGNVIGDFVSLASGATANSVRDAMSSALHGNVSNLSLSLSWSDQTSFKPVDGGLSGALYLRGNL